MLHFCHSAWLLISILNNIFPSVLEQEKWCIQIYFIFNKSTKHVGGITVINSKPIKKMKVKLFLSFLMSRCWAQFITGNLCNMKSEPSKQKRVNLGPFFSVR